MKKLLPPFILLLFCLFHQSKVFGQDVLREGKSVKLGLLKTDLKENVINIGIRYWNSLEKKDLFTSGDKFLFQITPDASIQTGGEDAFSSISVKATGFWMLFNTMEYDSVITVDTGGVFHIFPMSIGIETNDKLNILNGIFEIGYVPYYQLESVTVPHWIKRTKLGVFLQSGYKFELDTTGVNQVNGEVDESKEEINDPIFRAKASFGIDTKSLINFNYLKIGLVGDADCWYDFLNQEIYYKIEAKVRFYLSGNNYFDLEYQKGSGAPNFNEGEQYGVGLTATF